MSESSSDDFNDSGSDGSSDEVQGNEPSKKPVFLEQKKRKVLQKKKPKDEEDSSDRDDSDEADTAPQPVKKRKTLQDYLNDKVSSIFILKLK